MPRKTNTKMKPAPDGMLRRSNPCIGRLVQVNGFKGIVNRRNRGRPLSLPQMEGLAQMFSSDVVRERKRLAEQWKELYEKNVPMTIIGEAFDVSPNTVKNALRNPELWANLPLKKRAQTKVEETV